MDIHGDIPGAVLERASREAGAASLGEVVELGQRLDPPQVPDVFTQDEFTHDVVLRYVDGVHLVFDTT